MRAARVTNTARVDVKDGRAEGRRKTAVATPTRADLPAMQRRVGNAAVTAFLAGKSKLPDEKPETSSALRPTAPVQRSDQTGGTGEENGIEDHEYGWVREHDEPIDISHATVSELEEEVGRGLSLQDLNADPPDAVKLKLLKAALNQGAADLMWEIWASFDDLEEMAAAHSDLWCSCAKANADLYDLPAVDSVEDEFRVDVEYVRDVSLTMSRDAAEAELERYGITGDQSGLNPDVAAERQQALESFQAAATVVAAAMAAQELLTRIPVGYKIPTEDSYQDPSFFEGVSDSYHPAAEPKPEMVAVSFDPLGNDEDFDAPAEHAWFELKDIYDDAAEVIAYWTEKVPSLYALLRDNVHSAQLMKLAEAGNQQSALRMIEQSLGRMLVAILATEQAGIDPADLKPIHRRLFAGAGQGIGVSKPWDNRFYQSVAGNLVEEHEATDWWAIAGLGLAAAAIMVSCALAPPAGYATLAIISGLSAGVGVAEAVTRFEKADKLAVAAEARMRDEWAVVDEDQAAAERTKAQLALIFAGLDAIGVGPELRGLRAAGAAADVSDELLAAGARRAKNGPAGGPTLEEIRKSGTSIEPGYGPPSTEDVAVTTLRWQRRGARLSLPSGGKRTWAVGEYWPKGADKPAPYRTRSGQSKPPATRSSLTDPERHVLAPADSGLDQYRGIPSGLSPQKRKEWLEANRAEGFHPYTRAHDAEAKIFERLLKDTEPTSVGEFHFKVSHPEGVCPACTDMIFRFRAQRPGIRVVQH